MEILQDHLIDLGMGAGILELNHNFGPGHKQSLWDKLNQAKPKAKPRIRVAMDSQIILEPEPIQPQVLIQTAPPAPLVLEAAKPGDAIDLAASTEASDIVFKAIKVGPKLSWWQRALAWIKTYLMLD